MKYILTNYFSDIFLDRYIFLDCQSDLLIAFVFLLINTPTSLLIVINKQYVIFFIRRRRLYTQILFYFSAFTSCDIYHDIDDYS